MAGLAGQTRASPARRRARAVESFASASDCLGDICLGYSVFAITRGQFSMLDVASCLIRHVGECHVSVWTWAIADYEVECFEAFMANSMIVGASLVVDRSAEHKNAAIVQRWRDRFGADSVRVCKNHAKIVTVTGGEYRLLARGSMNLNYNPRFEQFDITEGGEDYELVRRIESELPVLAPGASSAEASAASKVGSAFDSTSLRMFEGVKPWAK